MISGIEGASPMMTITWPIRTFTHESPGPMPISPAGSFIERHQ
jgi:hypothetical protein